MRAALLEVMYLTSPGGKGHGRGGTDAFRPSLPVATDSKVGLARRLASQVVEVLDAYAGDGRDPIDDEVGEVLRLAQALAELVLQEDAGAGQASVLRADGDPDAVAMFRREGAMWHVAYAGRSLRLRDSLGLVYLGRLLSRPGERTHSLMLAAYGDSGEAQSQPRHEMSMTPAWDRNLARLHDLKADLDDSLRTRDEARSAALRQRIDAATEELLQSLRTSRRSPELRRAIERSRLNVSRAIAAALVRISRHHPPLAEHLRAAVRLGTFCVYLPDPRLPIRWES